MNDDAPQMTEGQEVWARIRTRWRKVKVHRFTGRGGRGVYVELLRPIAGSLNAGARVRLPRHAVRFRLERPDVEIGAEWKA